jgi:acyl-CoA reductase-like NAD-dependent aldehyde dehydrogenase
MTSTPLTRSVEIFDFVIVGAYIRGNVCAVKMNSVNEYLGPFYEHVFSEFISRGWLRLLYGGADVGGYLAHHPKVDTIHMTGSVATYDAIVWGRHYRHVGERAHLLCRLPASALDSRARRHRAALRYRISALLR